MISSPPLSATDRAIFRRELRQKRRALSPSQQKIAAQRLARHLAALPALQQARRIALYWPVDGEIDARALAHQSNFSRHDFYLPVLQAFPANTLRFARWPQAQRQQRNRFGIPEPRGRRALPAQKMDAILLPLTGFDAQGNRLGMGGGFYDRTLAFKRRCGHKSAGKPLLIGVAHACQQVPSLPAADWDVGLPLVVTDRKIFRK
ncbi:MAG: 5-formyltetrahydrofolate cyclo-ligase [Pedobacter sp.]|nr:5-formyltetrahydrofolate cyclo-ligase [Pedobacter sp.]